MVGTSSSAAVGLQPVILWMWALNSNVLKYVNSSFSQKVAVVNIKTGLDESLRS